MGGNRIEFFYDLSSPWTYIAFHNLAGVMERTDASVRLRPILVGGVFNAVNPSVYAAREAADNPKFKHSWRVMKDWAALAGIEINFPSAFHPAKSINAMRMACTLDSSHSTTSPESDGRKTSRPTRRRSDLFIKPCLLQETIQLVG